MPYPSLVLVESLPQETVASNVSCRGKITTIIALLICLVFAELELVHSVTSSGFLGRQRAVASDDFITMVSAPRPGYRNEVPKHVAIVMDGNRRWAKLHQLPTIAGHRTGAEVATKIRRCASQMGIQYLTLFAFSAENWMRDNAWVVEFMSLLRFYFRTELKPLMADNVRVQIIGDRTAFPQDIQDLIADAESQTKNNTAITLVVALSYGSRDEILRAFKRLAHKVKTGEIDPDNIQAHDIDISLDTDQLPDPDLLIRTSGEQRISNFLLWQMAFTEFVFVPTLWPDFSQEDFEHAIDEYQRRGRRFGGS